MDSTGPGELRTALRGLLDRGALDLPRPGGGSTRARWAGLAALGRADPALARLAEGHADAVAILTEADHPGRAGLLGVWASRSGGTGLTGTPAAGGGLVLDGTLRYCSGARSLDAALVVAAAPDGPRLVLLDLAAPGVRPVPDTWPAVGMAATDSLDVEVTAVAVGPDALVGGPGWYASRPGFAIGGIGVAAVWHGGALGVLDDLRAALDPADPHALAHLGGCVAATGATGALLDRAAAAVDAAPDADHRRLALLVRHVAEQAVQEVLTRAGRATGATPLCRDARHARRVADLGVYVRQQHAERDLAELGRLALEMGEDRP